MKAFRAFGVEEVVGSNPVTPTIYFITKSPILRRLRDFGYFCFFVLF